ncbi:MAG: hypothetical protein ABGY75_07280 [Gemmataceae bacterium]
MKVDFRAAGRHAAGMAWVAVKAFAGTLGLLTLAGCVLAGVSYYFLRDNPVYAAVGAAVAVVEGIVTGVVFGGKRAMVMGIAHGLGRLRLGRSLIQLVFDRILKINEMGAQGAIGERGGRIARTAERVPLARADEMLRTAVHGATGETGQGGWLRRTIQGKLLVLVQKYTLARFREEGAAHGGVDLLKVRTELEDTIDDVVVGKVRGGLKVWTILVIIGLPLAVALQTWIALMLLHAK